LAKKKKHGIANATRLAALDLDKDKSESSHTHSNINSINDLNKDLLKELEQFLVNYHLNDGAEFKVLARKGPDAAATCLKMAKT
jgi:inorganic pyrophosphatase